MISLHSSPAVLGWVPLFLLALLPACGGDGDDSTPAQSEILPVFKADFATSSEFHSFMTEPKESGDPARAHKKVWIWYTQNLKGKIDGGGTFKAPTNAMAIKRSDIGGDEVLDVMWKRQEGYDSANGDWYYAVLSKDGKTVRQEGKIAMCIDCHKIARTTTDYLRGTELR